MRQSSFYLSRASDARLEATLQDTIKRHPTFAVRLRAFALRCEKLAKLAKLGSINA
jgi:hypothetical protein